jgi:hypothetical protein
MSGRSGQDTLVGGSQGDVFTPEQKPTDIPERPSGPKTIGSLLSPEELNNFINDWSLVYNSRPDPTGKIREGAFDRMAPFVSGAATLKSDAKKGIATAVKIFGKDRGQTPERIEGLLMAIGAAESAFASKIQGSHTATTDDDGPARSYWQVEPATALGVLKTASVLFGDEFTKAFQEYSRDGQSSLEYLQTRTESQMSDLLLADDSLAATIAMAKWIQADQNRVNQINTNSQGIQ